MAYKTVVVADIGEVLISKRRGAKYIRLSITSSGKIRVGLPHWAPYAAGISFAKKRKDWIMHQQKLRPAVMLQNEARIGKSHRLYFHPARPGKVIEVKLGQNTIDVHTDLPLDNKEVQAKAAAACERALLKEGKTLLPQRLAVLAARHGYSYNGVRVRKLTSRWGSCSNSQIINLSYYLMQLPWRLIDYVLIHELIHTRHLNHGPSFWQAMSEALPQAKQLQKDIKAYNPRVEVL